MKETWGIDLNKLRSTVLRRQEEIKTLDLTLPKASESTHSNEE